MSAHRPHAPVIVLAMLAGLGLPGCDAIQKGRELGRDLARPDKFGTATREVLETGPKGTKVRLMIESKAPANWLDAKVAIAKSVDQYCVDGESFHHESEIPEGMLGGPDAYDREHPAGTTFTEVVQCSPPPPYEFALEAGTTEDEALEKVGDLLQGEAGSDHERFTVNTVSYNDHYRKYPAIARATGWALGARMARCPDGIIVNRMIIAAHPRPEPEAGVFLNRNFVTLGIDASCRSPDPGAESTGVVAP